MDNTETSLARLPVPMRCEDCANTAYWAWELQSICYAHIRGMADMNSDNEAALHEALVSPVVMRASQNEVTIGVYATTELYAIAGRINQLDQMFPFLDSEVEVIIELWYHQPTLKCVGTAYYSIDSQTIRCHAPIVKLSRAPVGQLSNFMQILNKYSRRIRECVAQEFKEESTTNG